VRVDDVVHPPEQNHHHQQQQQQRSQPMQKMQSFYDGWRIIREVVQSPVKMDTDPRLYDMPHEDCKFRIDAYLEGEHGDDRELFYTNFATGASVVEVGMADVDAKPTPFTAPAGTLHEIPIQRYIQLVLEQAPHAEEARAHDNTISVDVLPCHTAAAAVTRMGNGAMNTVYENHFLLGKFDIGSWRILSRTSTPHRYPGGKKNAPMKEEPTPPGFV
jgi:Putative lumazine-binding